MYEQNTPTIMHARYNCVCVKYGNGILHIIAPTTWKQHLDEAESDKENQHIITTRRLGGNVYDLPSDVGSAAIEASSSTSNESLSPSALRLKNLWAMCK